MPEIIFDRKLVALFGDPSDPNNTPEKLVEREEVKLTTMAEFFGLDSIEYQDCSKSGLYILKRMGRTLVMSVLSTPIDGGWLTVKEVV